MNADYKPLFPIDPHQKDMDKVARALLEGKPTPEAVGSLHIPANINKADYLRIPGSSLVIAREMTHKGKNWHTTLHDVLHTGLVIPPIRDFMNHFMNVKEAATGRTTLYTASGIAVPQAEAQDLWNYFSSTNRPKGNCWTRLDAYFPQGPSGLLLRTNHRLVQKKGKAEILPTLESPLEQCIMEDGFVGLSFNRQGLPTQPSSQKEYQQGENIYFWHPRKDAVAWFDADSGRAVLYCGRVPQSSNSALGVFTCAEGAPRP